MKSERRHELASNELASWITNLPQWFKDNKSTVAVAIVVIVALIAYTIFYYNRQGVVFEQKHAQATALMEQLSWQKNTVVQGKDQGLGVSDLFLSTAGSLANSASEVDNPNLAALTIIKRAEALRAELNYRSVAAEKDVRDNQLAQAQKLYEQALAKIEDNPIIEAMAKYGIALCLEGRGDIQAAADAYKEISEDEKYAGTSFDKRAAFRLATFRDYTGSFAFAAPQVVAQPQSPSINLDETVSLDDEVSQDMSLDMNSLLDANQ